MEYPVKLMVKVMKVISDENRIRILKMLEHKKMCVCELAAILNIKQPSVSRHLKKMKSAGIINSMPDSLYTVYYIEPANPFAEDAVLRLKDQLNDDPQILDDIEKIKSTDRNTLCCGEKTD